MFDFATIGLNTAINAFAAASDTAVVGAVIKVIQRSIEAMTKSLGGAAIILRGIFTNGVNPGTLDFILKTPKDLFTFLYDLARPSTVYNDGFPNGNPYNELDLRRPENVNAVICQVQRVALTITAILKLPREHVPPSGLGSLNINISLQSDFDKDGNPPPPTYISRLPEGTESSAPKEKWLFINGIANEFIWFQRSCDKIRDTFAREVKGVYNRSDGILWDLIECAGERSVATSNALVERTQSSKAAQEMLEHVLRETLWPVGEAAPDKVIMIAHSQGCLILRLALQRLVTETTGSDLKEKLGIFTFGNPSIDWEVIKDGQQQPLDNYVALTEHFAHEKDYVAKLGVVSHKDDYHGGSTFFSKEMKGHLFGAHYPLAANAYDEGKDSRLMKAVNGNEISFKSGITDN
ncbi:hypothetical protein S40285_09329 [Stachybotrys chlorohalonatus IBT 40285]|uniref:DUF676 domain-containing protein n=1 Tax=Stachybotrys chlorohalonatus (strain IBT 40285) TaxID=1283841 RepID=A0A084QVP6_STAC4|nr:hypothetical protein S40285_09329 [Stachybotrys chlorohalonata IBT 40285]